MITTQNLQTLHALKTSDIENDVYTTVAMNVMLEERDLTPIEHYLIISMALRPIFSFGHRVTWGVA